MKLKKLNSNSNVLYKILNRADYLSARAGKKIYLRGLFIHAKFRNHNEAIPSDIIRVGFTCSKKVGNAVNRNLAKRRLKAISREILPQFGRRGWDYILIGRQKETIDTPIDELRTDLIKGLAQIHLE